MSVDPRVSTPPLRDLSEPGATWGHDIAEWSEKVLGIVLDDWQKHAANAFFEVLEFDEAMRRAEIEDKANNSGSRTREAYASLYGPQRYNIPGGKLRFTKGLLIVPRQNGKSLFAQVVMLWFLLRKRSKEIMLAHLDLNHATKMWREIDEMVLTIRKLENKISKHSYNNGNLFIKTKTGGYLRPIGVKAGAGRGATNDLVFLDELRQQETDDGWRSLSATTTAPVNGFLLAASNAGDLTSVVLNEMQDKAADLIAEGRTENTSTCLLEWSADPGLDYRDERAWIQANPSLGHGRLTLDVIRGEMESASESSFRTEQLSQRVDKLTDAITPVIPISEWDVFGRAQRPRFNSSSVCVEVSPVDGRTRVVVDLRTKSNGHFLSVAPFEPDMSIDQTVAAVKGLVDQIDPDVVVIDKKSAAHVLIDPLSRVGIETQSPDYASMLQTWTDFERYFAEEKIFHEQSPVWQEELTTSKLRMDTKGQVIGFDRYFNHPQALQAAVLAVWGLTKFEVKVSSFKKVEPEERKQMILPRAVKLDRRPVWAS